MKRARAAGAAALIAGSLLQPTPLAAGRDSEVASALDPDDPFDVHVSIDYRYSSRRSAVKREFTGLPGTPPDAPTPLVKDLVFSGERHELVPRLEVGLFTDLALSAELPLVLREVRRLGFDQRAGDCVFPADPGQATCIDATNSTTVADGLLPAEGEDAGGSIFRGPNRSGLDQLRLGLMWAPMNQLRDPSKPTWKVGAELGLSVGEVMRFDHTRPGGENGVSRGVHELRPFTSMARRIGWAEPYFEIWWLQPIATRAGAPLDDLGGDFRGQDPDAPQRAGGRFGLEAILWERPSGERLGLQLGGELEATFAGREYSDMWELFAFAGDASSEGPLTLDADPIAEGRQARSHPGVSNVEDHLTTTGQAAIAAQLTRWMHLDAGFRLGWEQSHLVTTAGPGSDGDDPNDVVDPGTAEVNPLHVPLVDAPGHRYRVDEALTYVISIGARALF